MCTSEFCILTPEFSLQGVRPELAPNLGVSGEATGANLLDRLGRAHGPFWAEVYQHQPRNASGSGYRTGLPWRGMALEWLGGGRFVNQYRRALGQRLHGRAWLSIGRVD